MKKIAVVLSGGGSCGSYQIGVWKALRRLNIHFDIVTGTSVGALNGLMMVQNDYKKAFKLWSNLDYNLVFKEFIGDNDKKLNNKEIYLKYVEGFLAQGGVDTTNLELIISESFDEKKFYGSPINYGIVVYNLSKLKQETLTKQMLTPQNIKDYVVASATFYPGFKIKEINKEQFIDGGYGDNLPINLAISLGATEIIAVDLEQIGFKKKQKEKLPMTVIKPNNDIGALLIFDKEQSIKNIKYGYNDTLKVYHKLEGKQFSFYKFNFSNFIKKRKSIFSEYIRKYALDEPDNIVKKLKNKLVKKIYAIEEKNSENYVLEAMEFLGKALKLDDTKIYFYSIYNMIIKSKISKMSALNVELIKEKIKKNDIKSLLGSKYIIKYIYVNLKNKDTDVNLELLFALFPKEFLSAIYLISIE